MKGFRIPEICFMRVPVLLIGVHHASIILVDRWWRTNVIVVNGTLTIGYVSRLTLQRTCVTMKIVIYPAAIIFCVILVGHQFSVIILI
jgi:hypothetical protein